MAARKPKISTAAGPRRAPVAKTAAKDDVVSSEAATDETRLATMARHGQSDDDHHDDDHDDDSLAPDADDASDIKDKAKRGDLLDAVAARSPMKRSDLRVILELVLDEMGRALDEGRDLVVPPLGKISVKRRNPAKNGDVLVSRIKLHPRNTEALADPDEEG